MHRPHQLFFVILLISLLPLSKTTRIVEIILSEEVLKENPPDDDDYSGDSSEWDEFLDSDNRSSEDLDPGSWRPIFEHKSGTVNPKSNEEALYHSGVRKMIESVTSGDPRLMDESASEIEAAAVAGFPHAQSTLGFLYGNGQLREQNGAKAFLYHNFAADGGNTQSKMALAYTYFRQDMFDKTVKLYAELAEAALSSLSVFKDLVVIDPVRLHIGAEENKEELQKLRGEEDGEFQILEYQAQKGNGGAMYRVGLFYYFGLRAVKRDLVKALSWFLKAAEKGEPKSMELLGEMYASGAGVERNYTKALEWLTLASKYQYFSAYNGIGYMYVKGYGVENKNATKAKEYFEKAAENKDPAGFYNLGVLYLKGIGVKRDVLEAIKHFFTAASAHQPKAYYQLAKMFERGIGFKQNIPKATSLYKYVAERGPWSSLLGWALESYLKGEIGKAFLLYSRMAELGYEVAQSNAAWILEKYGEDSLCMGESGFCREAERHERAHSLWWQASVQGNEHAALLIGDAYYYGRGTEKDYDRAAEAYTQAASQSNPQAMFNLGYLHEHGQGRPLDLHLAKRYYDQALRRNSAANLPVTLALMSLWIRKNYPNSFLVDIIDSLPEVYPKVGAWVENVIMDEGNVTIVTLFVCLLTVLYLRDRQRRRANAIAGEIPAPFQANGHDEPALN